MKRNLHLYISMLLGTLLAFVSASNACTEIMLKAKDGAVMVGRSMEFGIDMRSNIMTSPRGKTFVSPTPDGKTGLRWTAKYGYLFMDFFGSGHPADGMNEKGLSFGFLYLPGYTQYPTVSANQDQQALSYIFFGDWLLGNFDSVAEVKQALQNVQVFSQPLSFGSHKDVVFPVHVIVTDASGQSIVIEFINHKMQVHDSKLGVLTNSPTYDWHINNLKNYANLSPYNPKAIVINGIRYSGTGQGAGAVGLPGDFTPPARFVKVTYLLHNAVPANDAAMALNTAQHIMNDVDIPDGAVRGVQGSDDPNDTTQWVVFKDLTHHVLYFKSYTDTTLQAIHLDQLDFSSNAPVLKMPIAGPQTIKDVTAAYKRTAG